MRGTYGETTAFCVALNIMMFNVYCSNVMSEQIFGLCVFCQIYRYHRSAKVKGER
jgi:hypothetical protein